VGLGISSGWATLRKASDPRYVGLGVFMFDLRSSLCFQVECRHAMFGFHV
jgi:hypothetical protein